MSTATARRAARPRPGVQVRACSTTSTPATAPLGVTLGAGDRPTRRAVGTDRQDVALRLFADAARRQRRGAIAMTRDRRDRRVVGDRPAAWTRRYYRFEVGVYAPRPGGSRRTSSPTRTRSALATNSHRTACSSTWPTPRSRRPAGPALRKPGAADARNSSIYELHVRDFSISDETRAGRQRGTYRAFTDRDCDGHAPPARPGRRRPHHRPPAADVRHRDDRGGRRRAADPACDLASLPAGLRPSSRRCVDAVAATRTASTGATTR